MKPLIGLSASRAKEHRHTLSNTYIKAIIRAGGIPVILPSGIENDIDALIEQFDGFVLTGGGDVDPSYFGEDPHAELGNIEPERDAFEVALAKELLKNKKPVLGICRGMQVLTVASGGSVYQDMPAQQEGNLHQHIQKAPMYHPFHLVKVEPKSLMGTIVGEETIKVNSYHHQAVKEAGKGFEVVGKANDGTIEVVESKEHPFIIGVQWHPEALLEKDDQPSLKLFEKFIEKCKA